MNQVSSARIQQEVGHVVRLLEQHENAVMRPVCITSAVGLPILGLTVASLTYRQPEMAILPAMLVGWFPLMTGFSVITEFRRTAKEIEDAYRHFNLPVPRKIINGVLGRSLAANACKGVGWLWGSAATLASLTLWRSIPLIAIPATGVLGLISIKSLLEPEKYIKMTHEKAARALTTYHAETERLGEATMPPSPLSRYIGMSGAIQHIM